MKNTIGTSGLTDAFLQGKILIHIRRGPYGGAAHYHLLADVAYNYSTTTDWTDPLFQHCYANMALRFHQGALPYDTGPPATSNICSA